MNQSSYIAAFLLAGFVLFLAANNRLSAYAAVLWGSPAPPTSTGGGTGSTQATGSSNSSTPGLDLFPQAYPGGGITVTPKGPGASGTSTFVPGGANVIGAVSSIGDKVTSFFGGLGIVGNLLG